MPSRPRPTSASVTTALLRPEERPPHATRARRFHVGDVLSIVTGIVLSPRGLVGVRDLYEYLAGGRFVSFYEVQESTDRYYRSWLLLQHPSLGLFRPAEVPLEEFVPEWVERRAREFGRYLAVPPIPHDHALHPPTWRPPVTADPDGGPYCTWPTGGPAWLVRPTAARQDATFERPVLAPPVPAHPHKASSAPSGA